MARGDAGARLPPRHPGKGKAGSGGGGAGEGGAREGKEGAAEKEKGEAGAAAAAAVLPNIKRQLLAFAVC